MGKKRILAASLLLVCLLAGCGNREQSDSAAAISNDVDAASSMTMDNEGNTLMADASPETSALGLYVYDGKTVSRGYLFDTEQVEEVLNSISEVNVEEVTDWTTGQITMPVYGLEMGRTDGWTIYAAWSNGYWITQEGKVYRFDYDFDTLVSSYAWEVEELGSSTAILPCAQLLSMGEDGWVASMLTPAGELTPPENIVMELVSQSADGITVRFTNNSGAEWTYGEYFGLQVLLNEVWYEVPVSAGNWGFNSIAYVLLTGEAQEKTFNFTMYGELPEGKYRLVTENLAVEFKL